MSEPATVSLRVYPPDRDTFGLESVPAVDLGAGRYRLLHSPGFGEGIAAGDVIELQEARPGYRVITRSGNLCILLVAPQGHPTNEESCDRVLRAELADVGGYLDGGSSGHWVFTVPLSAGWDTVEGMFERAVLRSLGSAWYYGNVYDWRDGETPLGWWADA